MKTTRTTRHRTGAGISLDDLRNFVEITKDLDGALPVRLEEERGQRDAVFYYLIVTETIDV